MALATWQRWWPAIGDFLADAPRLAVLAGYPFLLTVVPALASYLTTRRAAV